MGWTSYLTNGSLQTEYRDFNEVVRTTLTWTGSGYQVALFDTNGQPSSTSISFAAITTGGWEAGLRPDRIRVGIYRTADPLIPGEIEQLSVLYIDADYGYQSDTGSTYGVVEWTGVGQYVHECVIHEGGINTHLDDLYGLDIAVHDGDIINQIDFLINSQYFWTNRIGTEETL